MSRWYKNSYIRCRKAVIECELYHAESRQERGILMLYLWAASVAVQKCQSNVWAFFSGKFIGFACLENATTQAHWTCPVVIAPEIARRVMTRCVIHCDNISRVNLLELIFKIMRPCAQGDVESNKLIDGHFFVRLLEFHILILDIKKEKGIVSCIVSRERIS